MLKQAFDYRIYKPKKIPEFSIYPNPAKPSDNVGINLDIDQIDHSDSMMVQLRVFNTAGQEISSQTILGSSGIEQTLSSLQTINLSFVASGVYLVNLILTDPNTQQVIYNHTEKIIIQ